MGESITRVTVTAGRARELDLRWMRSLTVPAHVQIDVVDLGWRCDVSLSRRGEHVVVIGDLLTGERIVQSDGARSSPLVRFALLVFQQRQAFARTTRFSERGRDESAIGQIAAANPDAVLLAPGETIPESTDSELEDG